MISRRPCCGLTFLWYRPNRYSKKWTACWWCGGSHAPYSVRLSTRARELVERSRELAHFRGLRWQVLSIPAFLIDARHRKREEHKCKPWVIGHISVPTVRTRKHLHSTVRSSFHDWPRYHRFIGCCFRSLRRVVVDAVMASLDCRPDGKKSCCCRQPQARCPYFYFPQLNESNVSTSK